MKTSSKTSKKKKSPNIVDRSMKALGLHMDMKTRVSIMEEVLFQMRLDDFETSFKPMKRFFDDILSKPQALKPLFQDVKKALLTKHPAVLEFAEKALEEKWFSPSEQIEKSAHVAFVLEAMTAAMANSNTFANEVIDHIRTKEREIGIDGRHVLKSIWRSWPLSRNFFGAANAVSLDPAISYFRLRRQLNGVHVPQKKSRSVYKTGKISYFEYKFLLPVCKKNACHCSDWLRMNIYEAGVTEYNNGFKSNAISAHALSEDIKKNCHREVFKATSVVPEQSKNAFYASLYQRGNYFPTVGLSKDWVALYETWNMVFILGELDNLHFLFPKLLIPSVLDAKPENFLGVRIISLWLSINNTLFLRFDGKEKIKGPGKRRRMAHAWGKINEKYAFQLAKKSVDEDSDELRETFRKRFTWPFYHLMKLMFRFFF